MSAEIDYAAIMEAARLAHETAPRYLMLDEDGYVINVVVGDPSHCIHAIPGCQLCVALDDAPEGAGFGWRRDPETHEWTPPPAEEE